MKPDLYSLGLYLAQGFPNDYIFEEVPDPNILFADGQQIEGKVEDIPTVALTKSAQVRMCGNSVCPPVALAMIEANFTHEQQFAKVA